jgi:hypothetical protein
VPKQHPPGSKANLQANLTEIAGFITQADLNGSSRSNGGNGLPPPLGRSTDMRSALSSEQEAIEIQHSLRTNVQGDPVRFT